MSREASLRDAVRAVSGLETRSARVGSGASVPNSTAAPTATPAIAGHGVALSPIRATVSVHQGVDLQSTVLTHETSTRPQCFVSYAWGDATPEGREREAFVDRLCREAAAKGIFILRDKTTMGLGDSITKFMQRIGRGDKIIIVLSDKYLKSPFCMHELFEIWRHCREEDEEFLARIRVYTLPCAKIWTLFERAAYALYWQTECKKIDELVRLHGPELIGQKGNAQHYLIKRFCVDIADRLSTVADILQPKTFDEFQLYGFSDLPHPQT